MNNCCACIHIFGVVPNVCMFFCYVFDAVREKYNMYVCACFPIPSVWLIKDEKAEQCIK